MNSHGGNKHSKVKSQPVICIPDYVLGTLQHIWVHLHLLPLPFLIAVNTSTTTNTHHILSQGSESTLTPRAEGWISLSGQRGSLGFRRLVLLTCQQRENLNSNQPWKLGGRQSRTSPMRSCLQHPDTQSQCRHFSEKSGLQGAGKNKPRQALTVSHWALTHLGPYRLWACGGPPQGLLWFPAPQAHGHKWACTFSSDVFLNETFHGLALAKNDAFEREKSSDCYF